MAGPVVETPIDTTMALLATLRAAGIEVRVAGDHVQARPAERLTAEFRAELVTHKAELLVTLAPPRGFVTLKAGPTLPIEAIELAIHLEAIGVALATDANHAFIVPDDPRLTAADRAAIARWHHHLGACIEYEAPELT